jgi:hypothetical protein
MTAREMAELANRHLKDVPGAKLTAFEPGIRNEDNWWYVPVCLEDGGKTAYEFVQELGEIEDRIEDACKGENLRLLLFPAVREDAGV